MSVESRFPPTISIYEAIRARPGALARLTSAGLTPEYFDYRIPEAARALGMPVEQLHALIEAPPGESSPPAPAPVLAEPAKES